MCKYACAQFNNVIKFKNIKKFIENFGRMTLSSAKNVQRMPSFWKEHNCLHLKDKYYPTRQLHNLNKDISVYNKVAWEHVYSHSIFKI